MKRMLKVYYEEMSAEDLTIADVTYCCKKIQRKFNFFDVWYDSNHIPVLVIHTDKGEGLAVDYCPCCGSKVILKPSRLGDKE